MKSELQRLREQICKLENALEDERDDHQDTKDELEELRLEYYDLESRLDKVGIDTSTLDKLMMAEKLAENWHLLTMEDINAIFAMEAFKSRLKRDAKCHD